MRALLASFLLFPFATANSAEPTAMLFPGLAKSFAADARPLLQRYCIDCHSTVTPEGDLDLETFVSLDDVRRQATTWVKVAEMLDDGQMPPEDSPQPSKEDRARLREWVRKYLDAEARASAGDPGPVPLRRLSNAEYNYTVHDLTNIDLKPSREFPADGAAGEGFTNAAGALVMSPALLSKYLDAGKEIARHAVLLPEGFRFSASTTRRDQTEEILAQIRALYGRYTDDSGATEVNLQGVRFATNGGGRLPVERYLATLLEHREALAAGQVTFDVLANEGKLSPRYLASLYQVLTSDSSSSLLAPIRDRWNQAQPQEAAAIAGDIAVWQTALSRFQNVGHMKPWVVSVDPITTRQDIRQPVPNGDNDEVILRLAVGDAGDGNAGDFVVWEQPRFVAPGRPDLLLRDVRRLEREVAEFRNRAFTSVSKTLEAATLVLESERDMPTAELALQHDLDEDVLLAWFRCLGMSRDAASDLGHLSERIERSGEFDFVRGWKVGELPAIVANASDLYVRIPGNLKSHGVAVHPSPTQAIAVGWQSPIVGTVQVNGTVTHAHPECGNGVAWVLELRRGGTRQRLAVGTAAGPNAVAFGPIDDLRIRKGDLVALVINARDGNHSCDLTDVELRIKSGQSTWNLNDDVSGDILAGNPHSDRFGNAETWHFFTESATLQQGQSSLPEGSLLDRWIVAQSSNEKRELAKQLEQLLANGPPTDADHPDAALHRQLSMFSGPLLSGMRPPESATKDSEESSATKRWGLEPTLFGSHPNGSQIEGSSLCVQAPSIIEVRLPSELIAGTEFVTSGVLHDQTGQDGRVQIQASIVSQNPMADSGQPQSVLHADLPVLVGKDSAAKSHIEKDFQEFRRWFPIALCYPKIVPTDEVITLTLHHREDEPLSRLMLSDDERDQLDRLWRELHFVSEDALTIVDAFAQLLEYASQDGDPRLFEPLRKPIEERAAAFRAELLTVEPKHIDALIEFAARVYRRPLAEEEGQTLRDFYQRLRSEDMHHEEAFRLTLARLFVSPAFLYRLEAAPPGNAPAPVSDGELASRLSYFLWASMPDRELHDAANAGVLHSDDEIASQARRMLKDDRVRRLATEFACQWLQIYEFDTLDEKSERHFPEFAAIRDEMYEEPIRFFTDLFQRDGSILEILDADHTVLNEDLAAHYGILGVTGPEWRRVSAVKRYSRGGVLGFSATLAKHSGASRTSPTLRGAWISDVLLGEKLPAPPPDVPELPDVAATEGLTVRELVERHSSDPRCAGCHVRVDPFGFALERFDSIGRFRERDDGGRVIDTQATLRDGTDINGLDGVRDHLLNARRETFVKQFCRKLLGYALGRGVRLSDEPLLEEMQQRLKEQEYRFSVAVETIIRSPQFRQIRGRDVEVADLP